MFEVLVNDKFYLEYKKYNRCVLDYFILKSNHKTSHKDAVLYSMNLLDEDCDFIISDQLDNMKYQTISSDDFFMIPNDYEHDKFHPIQGDYHRPYWFLFLNPPHGTPYTIDDFLSINHTLFLNGMKDLEIYEWNVDWSHYFDDGLEWWGAGCFSIYDSSLDRYVVIFASSTD